jgi:hypothetical protein
MMRHSTIPVLLIAACAAAGPLHPDEAEFIGEPVRLTDPSQFLKAGESYIDPSGRRVIFQAIEPPAEGEEPGEHFAMYLGDLAFDEAGTVTGMTNIRRLSADGAANTCGWFHPKDDDRVLFATTTGPPVAEETPGYQRGSGRYRWAFPRMMDIVECSLDDGECTPLVANNEAYLAEGSWSPDGRFILYCSLESGDGDIYVKDTATGESVLLVGEPGYDGGPFFSPDGRRITYRSDRDMNDLLQIFVADLAFGEDGAITGLRQEHQLTDNEHVNWCPFWHPDGRHLIYATSQVGHHNYELFMMDIEKRGEKAPQRITHAAGFDGLPAFNADGTWLIWTSKRETGTSQLWITRFLMDVDAPAATGK